MSQAIAEPISLSICDHANIGLSTGFMEDARSDWQELARRAGDGSRLAVEFSALSEPELPGLIEFFSAKVSLPFQYVAIHAPSKARTRSDADLVADLVAMANQVDAIVVHPDVIEDVGAFRKLGRVLALENLDAGRRTGSTAEQLSEYFEALPEAGLCFDVAHAASVDEDMAEATTILDRYWRRLRHVHLSSLDADLHHVTLTADDEERFRGVLARCRDVPWILEAPPNHR